MKKFFVSGIIGIFLAMFFLNGAEGLATGHSPYRVAVAATSSCDASSWPDGECTGLPGEDTTITDILENIMNWVLSLVGILGIISFAVCGIMYLMAGLNEKMVESAKTGMQYSIIGIIVALSGLIIVNAILNALGGSNSF